MKAANASSSSSDLSGAEIDGEYARWRQALIQQVEQELEEQVRLRVGGNARRMVRTRSCISQPRLITPMSCCGTHPKATDPCSFSRLSIDENLGNGHARELNDWQEFGNKKKCLSVSASNEITKKDTSVCVSLPPLGRREADLQQHGVDEKFKVSMLWRYVSSKYGTPLHHLQYLLATGNFKSILHDSSGSGGGPLIRCPPEANISLATPTHLENVSSAIFPLMVSVSSISFEDRKSESKGENAFTGFIHGSKTEPVCQLKFESRFEGGNLQQAMEM